MYKKRFFSLSCGAKLQIQLINCEIISVCHTFVIQFQEYEHLNCPVVDYLR